MEPNISAWPQTGIGRNTEECWSPFDTRKIGECVHIKKMTWQKVKQCFTGPGICGIIWRLQLLLKDRLAFWVARDLIQPFISVIRERPNELLLKTRIIRRTNGWIGKHWKTTNVYKCHRNLRVRSHASPPRRNKASLRDYTTIMIP